MATFVLVHGAWHGGWCWQRMAPYLKSSGHTIFTPTLTGLGERSHLLSPSIDLTCHIKDVFNMILYEDLENVVLVGHSYGGMVITGVADKCADRLSQLVYLDALVPKGGQSTLDQLVTTSTARPSSQEQSVEQNWRIPPPTAISMGMTNSADIAWLTSKMTDHPLGTVAEPLNLQTNTIDELPKTFISCTVEQEKYMPSIAKAASRIREVMGWKYYELETGHDAMITAPEELAQLLERIAKFRDG